MQHKKDLGFATMLQVPQKSSCNKHNKEEKEDK
jgi:hypothetical protein